MWTVASGSTSAPGIAVTTVGNSAPRVVEAVKAQVERFTHTCFMVTPYESYVAVCEQLNALTPGDHDKRSALFNSGAEAVENAVKIARHATGRTAVVVFDHAYHGRTNLTMALTAKNMPYKQGFGPVRRRDLPGADVVSAARWRPDRSAGCSRAPSTSLRSRSAPTNVAAMLIEPIQGEGGFVVPAPGFLPALVGLGQPARRTVHRRRDPDRLLPHRRLVRLDHEGVVPDLITTAKGIAGGLPLAGVTGRADIMDAVHPGGLGGTYGGNPIACAAALASIETMRELDLRAAAREIEAAMLPRLAELAQRFPAIGEVRGRGGMLAIELVDPARVEPESAVPFVGAPNGPTPDARATAAIAQACHKAGLLVLTCGTYGNVLRFLPPLVMPRQTLEQGLDILADAIEAAL